MNLKEAAASLNLSEEAFFEKAYRRYGLALSPGGIACDLAWWKKWGTEPPYVKKYIHEVERHPPEQQVLPFA